MGGWREGRIPRPDGFHRALGRPARLGGTAEADSGQAQQAVLACRDAARDASRSVLAGPLRRGRLPRLALGP